MIFALDTTRRAWDRRRAERAVYRWSLGLAAGIGLAAAALPGELGAIVARRGYGFFAFWYLTVILLSTPWARFHRGRAVARVIAVREALGNATTFHVAGHVLAMGLMEPRYLVDYRNPEDLPGIVSSTIVAILAITSLPGVRRRIPGVAWKRLHRWVYVAWALIVLVVVMSRPYTAIPHIGIVLVVIGYRVALWRDRRRKGHRIAAADLANYAAMTATFATVIVLTMPEAMKDGLGIGLFAGIGS